MPRQRKIADNTLVAIKTAMARNVAQEKINWRQWSSLVSKAAGVHPTICENVLRAVNFLHSQEMDPEYEHSNLVVNLDPEAP